jgi:DnaJ domain
LPDFYISNNYMRTTRRARAFKRGGTQRGGLRGPWYKRWFKAMGNASTREPPKPPTKQERNALNAEVSKVYANWRRTIKNKAVSGMKRVNRGIEGLLSKGKNAFARAPENIPPSLNSELRKGENALKKYRAAKTRKNAVNAWEIAGRVRNDLSGNAAFKNVEEAFWKDMKKAKCVNTKNAPWRNGVEPDCEGYANYSKAALAARAARAAAKAKANANVEAEEAAGAAAAKAAEEAKAAIAVAEKAALAAARAAAKAKANANVEAEEAAGAAAAKAAEEAKAAITVAEKAVTAAQNASSPAEAESAARAFAMATRRSKPKHTLYEILGVSKNATTADIRRGYIKEGRALEIIDPTHEKYPKYFKILKEAYELLSNPQKREIYDILFI